MTQVGYLENLNPWTNGGETLEDQTTEAHSIDVGDVRQQHHLGYWKRRPHQRPNTSPWAQTPFFSSDARPHHQGGVHDGLQRLNHTTWRPITVSSSGCRFIGRYVGMVDGLTYFTFHPTFSNSQANNDQRGDLHAYNPANDTIYLVSSHNNLVKTAVIV